MMHAWLTSPLLMVLGFPLLYAGLLLMLHFVIEFAPRYIRQHRVSYRPIRTLLADALLIVRLALQRE